jgi:DNA-binding NtrC family response regulator
MSPHQPIIVVVDSDADRATARSVQLDRMGCHVFRRSSGIDALECVAEVRPEFVLSETRLLDLEAPELLRSIHESSPSTRVLFVEKQGGDPRPPETTDEHPTKEEVPLEDWEEITVVIDGFLEK